jgi:NADPH:quinone reductase-like Zn-dependent oxidoreductase
MAETMRSLRLTSFKDVQDLRCGDEAVPDAESGDVLVRVRAAGVNQSDVKNVEGSMAAMTTLPRIPGRDFAGTVASGPAKLIGKEVWGTGGDLGFKKDGTHAGFVILPEHALVPRPPGFPLHAAAAAGVPLVTAWTTVVRLANVTSGETLLVVGAAGAVGSSAVQIAVSLGARVVGVVRNETERAVAEAAGASDVAIAQTSEMERLAEATGGCDAAVDTVGGPMLPVTLGLLKNGGRAVVISTPVPTVELDLLDFYRRSLTLIGLNSGSLDSIACGEILRTLLPTIEAGALRAPPVTDRYPLDQAAAAYKMVKDGSALGRVVIECD